jgi:hypothetical protein
VEAQSASALQPAGHEVDVPLQACGDGQPAVVVPADAGEQVPFAVAPSDAAHTSQAAPHAALQQKPSTQFPLAHTRQPAVLQSAPAAGLQALLWAFCAVQFPLGAQK